MTECTPPMIERFRLNVQIALETCVENCGFAWPLTALITDSNGNLLVVRALESGLTTLFDPAPGTWRMPAVMVFVDSTGKPGVFNFGEPVQR